MPRTSRCASGDDAGTDHGRRTRAADPPAFVFLGPWSLVLGPWSLVLGPWSLVLGPWSLISRRLRLEDERVELELAPQGDQDVALKAPDERPYTPAPAGPVRLPTRHNPTLAAVLERVNADEELFALWRCSNVNAVDRLAMSDHGPVHVRIVSNIALRLLRLLMSQGIEAAAVRDYHLTPHDAEVIVVLAALLHDVGMSIHPD